jgi:hypothetical protein
MGPYEMVDGIMKMRGPLCPYCGTECEIVGSLFGPPEIKIWNPKKGELLP